MDVRQDVSTGALFPDAMPETAPPFSDIAPDMASPGEALPETATFPDSPGVPGGRHSKRRAKHRRPLTPLAGWPAFLVHTGFWFGLVWYLEMTFHLLCFGQPRGTFWFSILFFFPISAVFAILTGLFPRKVNRVLVWFLASLVCLYFAVQLIYHAVFQSYMSLSQVGMGGDAVTSFWREVLKASAANWWRLLLLFLPLPCIGLLMKFCPLMDLKRRRLPLQGLLALSGAAVHILALTLLPLFGTGHYSPKDLYSNTWVLPLSIDHFGVLTTARLEILNMLTGEQDGTDTLGPIILPDFSDNASSAPANPTIDTSPNVLDIDFAALAAGETDKTLKNLHEYFAAMPGTRKNEYTGYFEGYNLISICAESFSSAVISPELTPTLYRMANEGFVFKNFYASFPSNTIDGEYAFCNGLFPDLSRSKSKNSFVASAKNYLPFALGNQFNRLGCTSRAYHNYTSWFYDRHISHPNMGYIFKAKGMGLKFTQNWPTSDLEMMEQTVSEYIGDTQFHAYYMTFSGHMWYSFEHQIAAKNKDKVMDLPYSTTVKAYIASNLELEYALQYLLEQLEAAGVADRTVFALTTDHFPYGLPMSEYESLVGHEVDEDFEKYRNSFLLWNPGMEETIVVEDPCCTIDILPTLSNLFGLEYDSRLLMGTDILSDSTPIAILSNQSFITDKVMFNSRTGEITSLTNEPLPEGYVDALIQLVKDKFTLSTAILNTNYYGQVVAKPESQLTTVD